MILSTALSAVCITRQAVMGGCSCVRGRQRSQGPAPRGGPGAGTLAALGCDRWPRGARLAGAVFVAWVWVWWVAAARTVTNDSESFKGG